MNPAGFERNYDISAMRGDINVRDYSTDISAAMELLQEMRDTGNYDALELVKTALLRWATSHEEAEALPGEISGAYLKWKGTS